MILLNKNNLVGTYINHILKSDFLFQIIKNIFKLTLLYNNRAIYILPSAYYITTGVSKLTARYINGGITQHACEMWI